jgi:hypothetical protein
VTVAREKINAKLDDMLLWIRISDDAPLLMAVGRSVTYARGGSKKNVCRPITHDPLTDCKTKDILGRSTKLLWLSWKLFEFSLGVRHTSSKS